MIKRISPQGIQIRISIIRFSRLTITHAVQWDRRLTQDAESLYNEDVNEDMPAPR